MYYRLAADLSLLAGSELGARVWLHTPNPDLAGATPYTLRQGQASVIAELLNDALTGQPG